MKNYIFFVEGNQDVALLYRVLIDFLNFEELKNPKKLQEIFKQIVYKPFPFKKTSLNIFNEIPMFFEKDGKQICIINANGETNLLFRFDKFFDSVDNDYLEGVENFTLFADGDLNNKKQKIEELKNYIETKDKNRKLNYIKKESFNYDLIEFDVEGFNVKANIYIFPDNNDSGRIENIILENLKNTQGNLYNETIKHFKNIENKDIARWSDGNSEKDKALIGCIGNVIIPSASNVTLISNKDFEWINRENMTDDLKVLIAFLEGVLGE